MAPEANRVVLWAHQVDVFTAAGESAEGGVAVQGLVRDVTEVL